MNIVQHVLVRAYNPRENEVHTSFTFLIHPGILGGLWDEVRFIYIVNLNTTSAPLMDFVSMTTPPFFPPFFPKATKEERLIFTTYLFY